MLNGPDFGAFPITKSGFGWDTGEPPTGETSEGLPMTTGVKIVKTTEWEEGPVFAPSCARPRQ